MEATYHISYTAPDGVQDAQYRVNGKYLSGRIVDLTASGFIINAVIRTDDTTPEDLLEVHVPLSVGHRIHLNTPFKD